MRTRNYLILAMAVALIIPIGLFAQTENADKTKKNEHGMMGMHDMMKSCSEHCQQTSTSIDKVLTSLRDAKASNDPARMRAAIEEAEKPLGMMHQHMTMCMKMMNMMQGGGMGNMHGKGMSNMQGEGMAKMHGDDTMNHGGMHGSKDAANMAVDPVCGMKVDPTTAPSAKHKGETYYFCSAAAKAQFEKDPASFLRKHKE